jgi:hypothetical protein
MIVFGSGLYGKTDEVPGLFYVATTFGHLWFIPLVPTRSLLVFKEEATGLPAGFHEMCLQIPFSIKSALLGWGRTGTVITAVVAGFTALGDKRDAAAGLMAACISALAVGAFFAMKFLPRMRYATYERACALADLAGFDERGRTLLALRFERMSPGEAKEKLRRIEAEELDRAALHIAARKAMLEAGKVE